MNHVLISNMKTGDGISGYYVVSSINKSTARSGNAYISLRLQDVSGSIRAVLFQPDASIKEADTGKVFYLAGRVDIYSGALQLVLHNLRTVDDTDSANYDLNMLLPPPIQHLGEVFEQIRLRLNAIADDDYRKLCLLALQEYSNDIYQYPAAKTMHHNRQGGLAAHTLGVMTLAESAAHFYTRIMDESLITAGAFLHDLGKICEFRISSLGLVSEYTSQGQLLGHSELGVQMVNDLAQQLNTPVEKLNLVKHIILSHHTHGSTSPCFAEAEVVAFADNIDSCLDVYQQELACMEPNSFTSSIVPSLGKRIYRHDKCVA